MRVAMSARGSNLERPESTDGVPEEIGHPRGTLAIVIVFGLLFGLAWLATYFLVFLERGAPHH
jgi:hypothetical protein